MPTVDAATGRRRSSAAAGADLDGLIRCLAGGLLFGVPLLYTMEVWWLGTSAGWRLLATTFSLTSVAVVILVHTTGFRRTQDRTWFEVAVDSLEAVALSVVAVLGVLVLLGEVHLGSPFSEALGKLVLEVTPFALGAAVSRELLSGDRQGSDDDQRSGKGASGDLGATFIGAVFVAFSIAPTDEVPMLASAATPVTLVGLVLASLGVTYLIVFMAGFGDQHERKGHEGVFQHPVTETLAAYVVSLVASVAMLATFRRFGSDDPWRLILEHTVILGFPAAVGGAAGRLAV